MPLPVIANVFRVSLEWNLGSPNSAANVMHFSAPSLTASGLLTLLDSTVTSSMWYATASTLAVNQIRATKLDGSSVTQVLAVTGAKWTGAQVADEIPQMAAIVKIVTSLRGRSFRGRIFLPGVAENKQAAGILDATTVSNGQTAWNTFVAAMVSGGATLGVASYKNATFQAQQSVLCEGVAATQRRRMTRLR